MSARIICHVVDTCMSQMEPDRPSENCAAATPQSVMAVKLLEKKGLREDLQQEVEVFETREKRLQQTPGQSWSHVMLSR